MPTRYESTPWAHERLLQTPACVLGECACVCWCGTKKRLKFVLLCVYRRGGSILTHSALAPAGVQRVQQQHDRLVRGCEEKVKRETSRVPVSCMCANAPPCVYIHSVATGIKDPEGVSLSDIDSIRRRYVALDSHNPEGIAQLNPKTLFKVSAMPWWYHT
jgi:hypothetical protein